MFCSKCGTQLADNVKFCTQCGNKVRGGMINTDAAASAISGGYNSLKNSEGVANLKNNETLKSVGSTLSNTGAALMTMTSDSTMVILSMGYCSHPV